MYKCIIIDDEPHAIAGLKSYISQTPILCLLASYTDPVVALKEIQLLEGIDLIFIDVDMPKINGLELAKEIRHKTKKLVFTTAHTKYAFEAFQVKADAYLLKPYSLGKFMITINDLFPHTSQMPDPIIKKDFFFVKSKDDDQKIVKVKYAEVIAVESKLNYIMIYTSKKNILTYMPLAEIAKILTPMPNFMQLHRSYLINQDHIEMIDGNLVKMVNQLKFTVGERYRVGFHEFLSKSLIKMGKP
jgi:DNA-binding LytR/AlgR family response regulator